MFLRKIQEQQEMFRRLAEGPLRYIRENEAAIRRMQEIARGIDTEQFRHIVAFAPVRNPATFPAVSELTSAAFASFADSVREMQRYADQHREMVESANRAFLPMRTLAEQVQSMARFIDATRFTAATIDSRRIGELIRAAERQRDVVARLTDRLALRHADLIASLNLPEGRLASIPSFASELPTIDVFVHTEAVRVPKSQPGFPVVLPGAHRAGCALRMRAKSGEQRPAGPQLHRRELGDGGGRGPGEHEQPHFGRPDAGGEEGDRRTGQSVLRRADVGRDAMVRGTRSLAWRKPSPPSTPKA